MALASIIEAYWKPAYKYLRMKWSLTPDEAADLTHTSFQRVRTNAAGSDVIADAVLTTDLESL